jgi:hypothetical protein
MSVTFNRKLRYTWQEAALRHAAHGATSQEAVASLTEIVASENSGKDSIQKSVRYLRQLWIEPADDIRVLRDEALAIYRSHPEPQTAKLLCWGLMIIRYPFVLRISEILGRLLALQGETKNEQLKRRIREELGERETVLRSARYAVFAIADFGFVHASEKSGHYRAGTRIDHFTPELAAWFIRAFFKSAGSESVSRRALLRHPAFFMVEPSALIESALTDGSLKVTRESLSEDMIALAPLSATTSVKGTSRA